MLPSSCRLCPSWGRLGGKVAELEPPKEPSWAPRGGGISANRPGPAECAGALDLQSPSVHRQVEERSSILSRPTEGGRIEPRRAFRLVALRCPEAEDSATQRNSTSSPPQFQSHHTGLFSFLFTRIMTALATRITTIAIFNISIIHMWVIVAFIFVVASLPHVL